MGTFKVKGGNNLSGIIIPQGAKNEALQVISAVLLTEKMVTIDNIPDIIDINKLISLLKSLGVKVEKLNSNKYSFKADNIDLDYLKSEQFKIDGKSLRGSIMIVGPLLARFGKAYIPRPGGDKIGRRRLDTHFEGLIKLGAKFSYNKEDYFYGVESKKLKGAYILLDEASVTGTATTTTTSRTQSAQAELENHVTLYANYAFGNGAYFKGGVANVTLNTEESLGTGSKYGNDDIMGYVIGFGVESGNWRTEVTFTDYEDISLTSSVARTGVTTNNKIDADLDTLALRVSYAF